MEFWKKIWHFSKNKISTILSTTWTSRGLQGFGGLGSLTSCINRREHFTYILDARRDHTTNNRRREITEDINFRERGRHQPSLKTWRKKKAMVQERGRRQLRRENRVNQADIFLFLSIVYFYEFKHCFRALFWFYWINFLDQVRLDLEVFGFEKCFFKLTSFLSRSFVIFVFG